MLANCIRCGNLFDQKYRNICQSCIAKEEYDLGIVKGYLRDHKLATLPDVVRDTDVPLETILQFIDDRRLVLVEYPNLTFTCQECGKPTQNGRYCEPCTDKLVEELADATQVVRNLRKQQLPPPSPGYHSR